MKPFYGTMQHPSSLIEKPEEETPGIFYNGFYLVIDPLIFPKDSLDFSKINVAMFRYTSFLNTLPLSYPQGKKLRITGFSDFSTFKIEPIVDIFMNGLPFYSIYSETNGKPNIITK